VNEQYIDLKVHFIHH